MASPDASGYVHGPSVEIRSHLHGMIVTVTLNPSLDEWIRLPSLKMGRLNRATTLVRYAAGKGINVSRVIVELGAPTTAFAISGGEDGLVLRHLMKQLSVPCRFFETSGVTRNNYKVETSSPRSLTEINTPGPYVSVETLHRLKQALVGFRPRPRCVVLSGSLPPGVSADIYRRWIALLRRRGIAVFLDTSGSALRQGLLARPFCIKPNQQEAEELLGYRLSSREAQLKAVRGLLRYGVSMAILSLGKAGAILSCAASSEVWWAQPPKVPVDSTVGAGDSLVAGFVVGWTKGRSPMECLRWAVACGAATAMTPGTELCHRKDVKGLLARVRIRRYTF